MIFSGAIGKAKPARLALGKAETAKRETRRE